MTVEDSDAALVERAQGGVSDAFRVLVERHSRGVFRLAYRMTLNEFDAEDVVQEAVSEGLPKPRHLRRPCRV